MNGSDGDQIAAVPIAAARIERTAAPLRQQVVRLLREDILNGVMLPGQRLVENVLCASYGVSRTVVREAMRQLETEHLVRVLPAQGPIVRVLTEAEIRALYVVRAELEGLAGQLFCEQADAGDIAAMLVLRDRLGPDYRDGSVQAREEFKAQFYATLLAGTGNPVLAEMLASIHARIAIFRRIAFVDPDRVTLSSQELERIIEAIAICRDPEAARDACERHIRVAGGAGADRIRTPRPGLLPRMSARLLPGKAAPPPRDRAGAAEPDLWPGRFGLICRHTVIQSGQGTIGRSAPQAQGRVSA